MATVAPTPSGFTNQIPDNFHTTVSATQPYPTLPISTATESAANIEATRLNNALKARKRTKTGCLTCRRRRIKCGEERPTCRNCIKSKRDCEGYIPRVVFKEPPGGLAVGPHSPYFTPGFSHTDTTSVFADSTAVSLDGASYQAIAPRPTLHEPRQRFAPMQPMYHFWPTAALQATGGLTYVQPFTTVDPVNSQRAIPYSTQLVTDPYVNRNVNGISPSQYSQNNRNAAFQYQPTTTTRHSKPANLQCTSMTWPYSPASTISQSTQPPLTPAQDQFDPTDKLTRSVTQPSVIKQESLSNYDYSRIGDGTSFSNEASFGERYLRPIQDTAHESVQDQLQTQMANHSNGIPTPAVSQGQEPDDDWFDIDSDGETPGLKVDVEQANVGLIIARNAQQHLGDLRSMTNFIGGPNVLSTYNPAEAASPLKDPQTARVFCHFITATGPTLHVCERHPSNPAVIFSGRPVPKSKQALWSYIFPMLALRHQGLLHSMLALSSLHIAKLQDSSPTSSLRHYHYALRRVAKALGHERKRRDPATLAATLLLGYYEVTTAEHNKWNSHLSGARELILDIPYVKLAGKVDAYRDKLAAEEAMVLAQQGQYNGSWQNFRKPHDIPTFTDGQIDHNLINTIMGWDIRPGETGTILDGKEQSPQLAEEATAKDVDDYETQIDLFWWYAKQDTYQSILSGNRLLLSYDRWALCPPRAAVGRIDAVYGTMDHLLLLLARLADYAGKDLSRKKRAGIEAERAAKAARNSPPSNAKPSPSHPPPMYGMIPDPGPVRVPNGFSQEQHDRMYTAPPPSEYQPLDVALEEALTEWTSISHAFDVFHAALGPAYEPLSAEHMTPLSTPFGPAMYFRSYGIACALHLYHCGRIILARTHPRMPPAAMVAALIAKQQTEPHAIAIGRICAGIQPVSNTAPLNPHHGAALMDCCMGLFHSAIQYTDAAQRSWTITKLRDVARLTGWQTSSLVAAGCERAWIHYASIGKGPHWERTMNKMAKDDRVAGRSMDPEHLRTQPKDNNDRRFVKVNAGTRVYWAMGLLSMEEDMKELNVGE